MGCVGANAIDEDDGKNRDFRLINGLVHSGLPIYVYRKGIVLLKRLIGPIFCETEMLERKIQYDLKNAKCPFCEQILLNEFAAYEIEKLRNSCVDLMLNLNLVIRLIERDYRIDIFEELKRYEDFLKLNEAFREKFYRVRCKNLDCRKSFILQCYEYYTLKQYLTEKKNEKYLLENWENNENVKNEIINERTKNASKKKADNEWEICVFEKDRDRYNKLIELFEDKIGDKTNYYTMEKAFNSVIYKIPDDLYYETKMNILDYIKTAVDEFIASRCYYTCERSEKEIKEKEEFIKKLNQ